MKKEWYGVDLDGTWAEVDETGEWDIFTIGEPIRAMTQKVLKALEEGKEVKVFTARVGTGRGLSPISGLEDTQEFADAQRQLIQDWTEKVIGIRLEVTAQKDWGLVEIWDDRARQVAKNKGHFIEDMWRNLFEYIYDRILGAA